MSAFAASSSTGRSGSRSPRTCEGCSSSGNADNSKPALTSRSPRFWPSATRPDSRSNAISQARPIRASFNRNKCRPKSPINQAQPQSPKPGRWMTLTQRRTTPPPAACSRPSAGHSAAKNNHAAIEPIVAARLYLVFVLPCCNSHSGAGAHQRNSLPPCQRVGVGGVR